MAVDAHDVLMLERAFSLAEKGRGCTSPNPVVGAVIVRDAHVLGEGYHAGPGLDHAEVSAIKDAIVRAGGAATPDAPLDHASARRVCEAATLYDTLEPCCTYGRTPPCTGALIGAGFARGVGGAIDPTPAVNGQGLALLRSADISVDLAEGELADRMKRQNDGMRKIVATGLPFVTYKYAMTADGRLATDTGGVGDPRHAGVSCCRRPQGLSRCAAERRARNHAQRRHPETVARAAPWHEA